jgi:O-acetyl-ADP-ribose deacetylase (regulator of RNase III)
MGYVTQWGGMEVGTGMLFASNTVDGLVHQLGGWRLALQCRLLPVMAQDDDEKCPVGHAVATGPGGSDLQRHFDWIVHTVPPFYHHYPNPEQFLLDCYHNAFAVAFEKGSQVCSPLLGAGCRGFPVEIATNLAAKASMRWCHQQALTTRTIQQQQQQQHEETLAFAIPDIAIAQQLIESMEKNADIWI